MHVRTKEFRVVVHRYVRFSPATSLLETGALSDRLDKIWDNPFHSVSTGANIEGWVEGSRNSAKLPLIGLGTRTLK